MQTRQLPDASGGFAALLLQRKQEHDAPAGFEPGKLKSDLDQWQRDMAGRGASQEHLDAMAAAAPAFAAIMEKAAQQKGYTDPQGFLQSLSSAELDVVRRVHGLAAPIAAEQLDHEGALNLLAPPNAAQDLDKDGLVSVGAAKLLMFPPSDAPDSVKEAWKKALADLPASEQLMAGAAFLLRPPLGSDGLPRVPGADTDYAALVRQRIDAMTRDGVYDNAVQHEYRSKQAAFLSTFLHNLEAARA